MGLAATWNACATPAAHAHDHCAQSLRGPAAADLGPFFRLRSR
jgi:hypothetical protein